MFTVGQVVLLDWHGKIIKVVVIKSDKDGVEFADYKN